MFDVVESNLIASEFFEQLSDEEFEQFLSLVYKETKRRNFNISLGEWNKEIKW